MASRTDQTWPEPDEAGPSSSFGELMNGFTLDSGRRGKRRRQPVPPPPQDANGDSRTGLSRAHTDAVEHEADDIAPAVVRPYAWTRGRTTSQFRLELETLLSTMPTYSEQDDTISSEHHAVAALCHQPRSVAEVAATLHIPLGVARVLAGDMAADGLLSVHDTASVDGESPDVALMERILSGLRRL